MDTSCKQYRDVSDANENKKNPIFFRQCTIAEYVTPTKEGFFAAKEVTFSMGYYDSSSPSYKTLKSKQMRPLAGNVLKNNMLLWSNGDNLDSKTSDVPQTSEGIVANFKSVVSPHRRGAHIAKKIKVEGTPSGHKESIRKRRLIEPKRGEQMHKNSKKLHWKQIILISLFPLFALVGLTYLVFPIYPEDVRLNWNIQSLKDSLHEKVFGQEEALASLLKILDSYFHEESKILDMPVILFSGSNGVGKSFVSSIVASHFPPPGKAELIHVYPPPHADIIFDRLSGQGPHLIVVDDFNYLPVEEAIKWAKNLRNHALWLNKSVLVFLIFNVQGWSGDKAIARESTFTEAIKAKGNELFTKFTSSGLLTHHINFSPLSSEHVKRCIAVALKNRGIYESVQLHKYVNTISNHLDHFQQGCKTVWSHTASIDMDVPQVL